MSPSRMGRPPIGVEAAILHMSVRTGLSAQGEYASGELGSTSRPPHPMWRCPPHATAWTRPAQLLTIGVLWSTDVRERAGYREPWAAMSAALASPST